MQRNHQYFEHYRVGEKGKTCGRTLSEGDLTLFSGISGDFAPAHVDNHFMPGQWYGKRIGHGWYSTSLILGMLSYFAPHIVGRNVPSAYVIGIKADYPNAFCVGDSVHLLWAIEETSEDKVRPGFGIVNTAYQLVNQDGNTVNQGVVTTGVRMQDAISAQLQFEPGMPEDFVEFVPDPAKIYVLEDFEAGTGNETYGRTVTETDVVNFMGLTQDYNRVYLDSDYAAETVYGETIAPPMLVPVIVTGFSFIYEGWYFKIKKLAVDYAGHLREEVSFLAPARIGDQLHCRKIIESTRISKSKPDRGIITFRLQGINQRNEVLVEIRTLFMLPTKAAATDPIEIDWLLCAFEDGSVDGEG